MTRRNLADDAFPAGPQPMAWHGVFVPAVMSVGVLFSVATLLRDAFRWVGGNALERRTALNASAAVSWLTQDGPPDPDEMGMLPRPSYLVSAFLFGGAALYVAIGSIANFLRDGGYVADIGWLLAVSLALSVVLIFLGVVALSAFWQWPYPPSWAMRGFRAGPFTTAYHGEIGTGPSWAVTTGIVTAAVFTGLIAIMVGTGRGVAMEIDQPIASWLAELVSLQRLQLIDVFGATWLAVALAATVGLAAVRCRVMAWAYPAAVAIGLFVTFLLREVIERPRPNGLGVEESFPSGHMVQAVLIAGLLPLAGWVLSADHRTAAVSRVALWMAVAVTALRRVHIGAHWPLDALAGIGLGLILVLGAHWVLQHSAWHGRCRGCPWAEETAPPVWPKLLIHLSDRAAQRIGLLGSAAAVAAAGALFVATIVVGVPVDPEGYGLSTDLAEPVQLTLVGIVLVSGFVALRWRATAAVAMALAGTGLGVYSAVQYEPWAALVLTGVILVPAVLTWVAWQKDETISRIAVLAATTAVLMTVTWVGANQTHAAFFGPTHPESTVVLPDMAEASWVWVGGVETDRATIVVGGLDDEFVDLWLVGTDGTERVTQLGAGANGIIRHTWTDLTPGSEYRYVVVERGDRLPRQFDGRFATFSDGPQDLTVVFGACARTGSNASVFDTMLAESPDLYVNLGDLHYSNLESTAPSDHITEYHRVAAQPAQAQLFRSTPFAYVWDDHDFGPNDADSSAASRRAVSLAYRRAVPNYGVDPDAEESIAQAFTLGRVRFILTDTRSMRTDETMLGPDQERWLIHELVSSSESHALVVWVNPTPWVADVDGPGADDWSGYSEERQRIGDAIAAAGIENLIMVSGDAHMLAIDDGTNTDYSSAGGGGFPLLHAAALDRPGSVKGGPYSEGAFPGGGQYGVLEIEDDGGDTIGVTLSGRTWGGETLVTMSLEFDVPE